MSFFYLLISLAIISLFLNKTCFLSGILFLSAILSLFLYKIGVQGSFWTILLIVEVLAIPACGFLGGIFLDKFIGVKKSHLFSLILTGLAIVFLFNSNYLVEFFISALKSYDVKITVFEQLTLFLSLFSAIIFSAALIAICIMLIQLLFELPLFVFLKSFLRTGEFETVSGLRPLLIILLLSSGINIITGFLITTLNPLTLIAGQ